MVEEQQHLHKKNIMFRFELLLGLLLPCLYLCFSQLIFNGNKHISLQNQTLYFYLDLIKIHFDVIPFVNCLFKAILLLSSLKL